MKREDLAKLNIAGDSVDKIMALHGRDIEKHKTAVSDSEASIKALQAELLQTQEKLNGYNPEWQSIVEAAKKEAQDTLSEFKFNNALSEQLFLHGAKEAVSVKAHLNFEQINYSADSGEFSGLSEQIAQLKDTHGFLFESDSTPPVFCSAAQGVTKTRPHVNDEANSAIRALFGKD